MDFYAKVIALCRQKGVSRSKMADDIGLSRSTPKDWEKKHAAPHFATIKKIADYFGVPVSFFSEDAEERPFFPSEEAALDNSRQPLGDIEKELLSICSRLNMKEKGALLLHAYALLEKDSTQAPS